MQTILFLSANPKDTGRLRLDQELRDIAEGLQRAQKRDQFNLEQRLAMRPRDIQRAMLDVGPQIIHFSGHGVGEKGLVFEDEIGNAKLVDGAALAGLFELFADQINCVVLNGCYSEVQAKAIAQHIPYVIGMTQGIGDEAAIAFAVGFYDALGAGRDVEFAYKLGCAAIRLEGMTEHLTPVLLKQESTGEATVQIKPDIFSPSATPALPASSTNEPIEVSYSHKDDDLREEFVTHLANLKQQKITTWHDRAIEAGDEWERAFRSRTEVLLLQTVKEEIVSRLGQSLTNSVLINLSKEFQPSQVNRTWEVEVKIGSKPSETIPLETSILEIFDRSDIAGKLLILGDPGSGKTTMLLDLAESLVNRAEEIKDYPIPVLFSLSSWKNNRQKIEDWLVAELNFKYGVRASIAQKWLQDRRLLPLLDGLDELEASQQGFCIQAINRFLTSQFRPLHITVCSRRLEYEINDTKLLLNGAIFLQALSDEKIQFYFEKTGLQTIKQNFASDSEIWALLKSPLLLTLVTLAYQEISLRDWQALTSTDERRQYLLDAYIRRMFDRPIKNLFYKMENEPTKKQSQQWLTYLAKRLNAESQTEFFIERIQPTWLSSPIQKTLYYLLGAFFGALLGCLVFGLSGLVFGKSSGILFASIGTLTTGLGINLNGVNIRPVERLQLSNTNLRRRLIFGLTFGLTCSLVFWVSFDYFVGTDQGKIMGISSGLTAGLINFLYGGLSGPDIVVKNKPNQGIRDSFNNACISGLSLFLLFGLIGGLSGNLLYSIPGALIGGLSGWLIGGGLPAIQHFALRIVLWANGYIPWNYARFLNFSNERMLLQRTGGSYRFIHKLVLEQFTFYAVNKDR